MASIPNQTISSFQCSIDVGIGTVTTTNRTETLAIARWTPLVAVNIVTSPLTVLINFLVIWTVLEKERLRTNNYYLLVAILSMGDLLVGLVVQPLLVAVIVATTFQYNSHLCELNLAHLVCGFLCYGWSFAALVTVSLERYLYIEHPLRYQTSVTSKKLTTATITSWVIIGISALLSKILVDNSHWTRQLPRILIFGSSFVIILFCVAKINLTAYRQMRAIAALPQPAAQQSKIKEYKRSFTLGLIVLASVACFCPVLILKIVLAVKGNWNDDFIFVSHSISFTCVNLQSLVNPIIYSLRLSDIRTGIAKRLCRSRQ